MELVKIEKLIMDTFLAKTIPDFVGLLLTKYCIAF